MLTALRSKGSSWIVRIMFLLLILSFVGWGIGDYVNTPIGDRTVAEVGNVEINSTQLRYDVDRDIRRLQSAFGGNLDLEQARQLGVVDRALSNLVEKTLFTVYAQQLALAAPDDLLQRRLFGDPAFRDAAGNFDHARFTALLRDNNITEASYIAAVRDEIRHGNILNAMGAGIAAPRTLAEALHDFRGEKRVAMTILVPDSSIVDLPVPDDAALAAFHAENADRYQAPGYRNLTIVRLEPELLVPQIKIPEEELRAAYESRKAEFDVPERRHIQQIVLPDEAAAKGAFDKLKQGRTFADVAREAGNRDPIDLGTVTRGELAPVLGEALADAAFATPAGQTAEPRSGPLGWHVISVLAIEPAKTSTFEEARDRLNHDLALREATDGLIQIANQLDDQIGGGASLADAAAALDLPVQTVAAVDATGKAPDGADVTDLAGNEQLLGLAFATAEGEDSPQTETSTGGYVVLRVNSVTPAALRPLAELREKVLADWQDAERQKAAAAKAQSIAERIQSTHEDLAKVATEMLLPVLTSQPVSRDAGDDASNVSAALAAKLFELKVGEVATSRGAKDDGEVVAVLTEVKPAGTASAAAEIDALRQGLVTALTNDVYQQFSASLRRDIPVSIDERAVQSLF